MNISKIIKALPKTSNKVRFIVHDFEQGRDSIKNLERAVATIRYKALISIISMRPDRIRSEVISDFERVFQTFLREVLELQITPWEIALRRQSAWWYIFDGFVIDLIRTKLIMIGYDPKVWLEAGK
ncbi:hypothetical protein YUBABA_00210 [Serratia phage vB_SmaM-Yubaba]|nr:hypothetical protein YUBABA_00210 [Serratia phage vB_SmaM-Yubaba]